MPVDKNGTRADVIKYSKAGVARMNSGVEYERYINGASRDLSIWIRRNYNTLPFDVIWNKLASYYEVVAPMMYDALLSNYTDDASRHAHIQSICESGIYLYIRADAANITPAIFRKIQEIAPPTYDAITYRNLAGEMVTTVDKAFIGSQQMIILEKTDQHPMAASSALLQHHGLLAATNRISRQGHPSKVQPVRVFSETEVRLFAATMGSDIMALLLNMSNSPETHKIVVASIINSNTPTNLPPIEGISLGSSRPQMFINNVLTGFGIQIKNNK